METVSKISRQDQRHSMMARGEVEPSRPETGTKEEKSNGEQADMAGGYKGLKCAWRLSSAMTGSLRSCLNAW